MHKYVYVLAQIYCRRTHPVLANHSTDVRKPSRCTHTQTHLLRPVLVPVTWSHSTDVHLHHLHRDPHKVVRQGEQLVDIHHMHTPHIKQPHLAEEDREN